MRRLALLTLLLGACEAGTVKGGNFSGGGGNPPGAPTPGGSGPPTTPGSPGSPNPPATMPPGGNGAPCGQLVPVSSPSLADLSAAPGARVRVRAQLVTAAPPSAPWTWTVLFGEGAGTLVDVVPLDAQRSVVEIPLEMEGRYQISASVAECKLDSIAHATLASGRLAQFRVRLAPPAGLSYPVQDSAVQVKAGAPPSAPQPFVLLAGTEVTLEPHDSSGNGSVAAYIRITEPLSRLTVEGHTALLPFKARLLPSLLYDVLFVPDGEVAPVLALGQAPSSIAVLPLLLSPGTALGGKLVDGAGAAVRDARVILRAGALTSTVGASDATGAWTVHARAGTFALSVSPPAASGLPDLALGSSPAGLAIPDAVSAGSADIAWAPLAASPVSLAITGADGRPAGGARVALQRADRLAAAATLTWRAATGPATTIPLDGLAHADGLAGADGSLTLAPLPAGRYQVTLIPADGDGRSGLTSTTLDLAPGSGVVPLKLAERVTLRGALIGPAGTRVYATPALADPPRAAVSTIIAADGSFALAVDPGRDYLVWADPPAGRGAARAQLARVPAGTTDVPMRTLPRALSFPGLVSGGGSAAGQGGVVVQVFCDQQSPSCLDPTLPLAEAITGPDGVVSLALPDPGSL